MPTNDHEKVLVNGKEVEPMRKVALHPDYNWQEIALEKQKEVTEEPEGDSE